jgi:arylsulfatase
MELSRGETPDGWREAAYSESYNNIDSSTVDRWARTIRTDRYRYTMYPGGSGEQLFDLTEDPDEQRNLAGDPAQASVRQELRDRLMDLIILQDHPHTPRELFAHGVH